jgi:hypothetical protein
MQSVFFGAFSLRFHRKMGATRCRGYSVRTSPRGIATSVLASSRRHNARQLARSEPDTGLARLRQGRIRSNGRGITVSEWRCSEQPALPTGSEGSENLPQTNRRVCPLTAASRQNGRRGGRLIGSSGRREARDASGLGRGSPERWPSRAKSRRQGDHDAGRGDRAPTRRPLARSPRHREGRWDPASRVRGIAEAAWSAPSAPDRCSAQPWSLALGRRVTRSPQLYPQLGSRCPRHE